MQVGSNAENSYGSFLHNFYGQWADLIFKGNRFSRLPESLISMGQIHVLITRQHRADVFLDEVDGLGLGG